MLGQKKNNPVPFAKIITADDLKKRLYIVAGREMEGRETAMPGQKKAAAYIEEQFKSLGLKPCSNGNYQLPYFKLEKGVIDRRLKLMEEVLSLIKILRSALRKPFR